MFEIFSFIRVNEVLIVKIFVIPLHIFYVVRG